MGIALKKRAIIKSWILRYAPSEILGTITAILGVLLARFLFGEENKILTAYFGTMGENVGFYSLIIRKEYKEVRLRNPNSSIFSNIWKTILGIIFEFGPAEALDSLALRPFFMFLGLSYFESASVATIIGKICADVTFYIPTIFLFEVKKRIVKKLS